MSKVTEPRRQLQEITKRTQLLRCSIRSIGWRGENFNHLAFVFIASPPVLQEKQLLQGPVERVHERRFVSEQRSKRLLAVSEGEGGVLVRRFLPLLVFERT